MKLSRCIVEILPHEFSQLFFFKKKNDMLVFRRQTRSCGWRRERLVKNIFINRPKRDSRALAFHDSFYKQISIGNIGRYPKEKN